MSITVIIEDTPSAVDPDEGNEFTTTGPFVLYGDGFGVNETARLFRLGPSETFHEATNEKTVIEVSAFPNMVYVDTPGTFRIKKMPTRNAASVGYEEV